MDNDTALRLELIPAVERLLERHLGMAKEWFPHEMVPWSRGEDFTPGETWEPDRAPTTDVARRALAVNLLTEDNLPHYFRTISGMSEGDAWATWARRWTAEEGRHAIVIRAYLSVTRSVDLVALERARMNQVSSGIVPDPEGTANGLVYVALQELATRIAHRNTGKHLDDQAGRDIMSRVAADENLHHLFYRDLVTHALAVEPSTMVEAIDRQVRDFEMPGAGIPDFSTHARVLAAAGIYDFAIHHDQILVPLVFSHWNVPELTNLSPSAELARDRLLKHIERLGRVARRLTDRRAEPVGAGVGA
jgi:acyl-[acyl-carrier-protein] desaturase